MPTAGAVQATYVPACGGGRETVAPVQNELFCGRTGVFDEEGIQAGLPLLLSQYPKLVFGGTLEIRAEPVQILRAAVLCKGGRYFVRPPWDIRMNELVGRLSDASIAVRRFRVLRPLAWLFNG